MLDPARRRKILDKMENNLSILLSKKESESKITKAVKKVREAKLSYFKGQKRIAEEHDDRGNEKLSDNIQQHLSNIDKNIEMWESISDDEVIQQYCDKDI